MDDDEVGRVGLGVADIVNDRKQAAIAVVAAFPPSPPSARVAAAGVVAAGRPNRRDDCPSRSLAFIPDWTVCADAWSTPTVNASVPPRENSRPCRTRICTPESRRIAPLSFPDAALLGTRVYPVPGISSDMMSTYYNTRQPQFATGKPRIATEANSRYRACTRSAFGQPTRDRRCGHGWTAV